MKKLLTLADVVRATGGSLKTPVKMDESAQNLRIDAREISSNSLAAVTAGTLTIKDITLHKVVYDSRQVVPGTLFVAMPGENTDGHNYIGDAVTRGTSALLVRQDWLSTQEVLPPVPCVVVEDTLLALQALAKDWRSRFPTLNVIGITGSVGKTSTKELAVSVLKQHYNVYKTPKSYNNEYSLMPLIFELNDEYQQAVLEMGAGWEFGELTRVCRVALPRIGVELGVSHSHMGRMGSLENLARNKAELVESLPPDGWAVLNGDDLRVKAMSKLTQAKVFYYGTDPSFDLWAGDIESLGVEGVTFTLNYRGEKHPVKLPLPGRHSVYTALAATAIGLLCGLNFEEVETGLRDKSARVRVLVKPGANGSTLIDDCYNASPVSTNASLDYLTETGGYKRKLAILGDMLELGDFTEEGHRMVGRRAAQVLDHLVVVGELARLIGEEAITSGLTREQVTFAGSKPDAIDFLKKTLQEGDLLLVKASRGMALEEVIAGISEERL